MKKLLLQLLELLGSKETYRTGTKAPISGVWRSGKEYIPLTKGKTFPPSYNDVWVLVVSL